MMITGNALLLYQSPYFQGLSAEDLALVQRHARYRALAMGETVVLQGQPAEALYLVECGRVRVYTSTPEGREQVLYVARPGDTFNDVAVFDGGMSLASAQALGPDTSIWAIPVAVLGQILATDPRLAASAVRVLTDRVRQLAMLVADLSLRDATQRIAKLLMEEGATSGEVALAREEIAARVGTVREVVSRAFAQLERSGAITRHDHHSVRVDPALLNGLIDRAAKTGVTPPITPELVADQSGQVCFDD